MHETGLGATCFDDFLNAGFLTEGFDLSDELDFNAVLLDNVFGVFPDYVPGESEQTADSQIS